MGTRNIKPTPLPQGSPGAILLRNLNWFTCAIFVTAELAMSVVGIVSVLTGGISTVLFLISFAIFTALILGIVVAANILARKVLLRFFLYETGLVTISKISTEAVLFWGTDNVILAWSSGAERAFGYASEDTIGIVNIALLFPAGDLETLASRLESSEERNVRNLRISGKSRNGELFPIEASVSSITLPDGKPFGTLAVMRDITERQKMEQQLIESEERYRALFGSSADGICYTDVDGVIQECNQAMTDMLSYEGLELKGVSFQELAPADARPGDEEAFIRQMTEDGYSDEYSTVYMAKNGERIPVSVRSWMVYNDLGQPVGAWAIIRNQSERLRGEQFVRDTIVHLEQANDRLLELDRLKTELVAVVSHELRAPLGAIESSLNAMKSLNNEGVLEEQEELMGVLDRGVQRLSDLVEDLMDLTRIESGQLKLDKARVDAVDLAARVVRAFEDRFSEKGLEILLKSSDSVCTATCDASRIEQVLTNLIDNAFKYTDEGQVVVSVERMDDSVVYTITDSGRGVPPGLHDKIFEKFFCLDVPSEGGKQGIGLGLAICKGIVEAHGGRISVESRQGQGTTFIFSLPI